MPTVFLQITPDDLPIEISGSEVDSTQWIPLRIFFDEKLTQLWNPVSVDISSRLAPNSLLLQTVLMTLTGRLHFHCIKLPFVGGVNGTTKMHLDLWGLTLQMTSDLIDLMFRENEAPQRRLDAIRPKFDYWDVNFFTWCFLRNNRISYKDKKLDLARRRLVLSISYAIIVL